MNWRAQLTLVPRHPVAGAIVVASRPVSRSRDCWLPLCAPTPQLGSQVAHVAILKLRLAGGEAVAMLRVVTAARLIDGGGWAEVPSTRRHWASSREGG